jgi:hypothetical protein
VVWRQELARLGGYDLPTFTAPLLEHLLSAFPDAVLAPHRKKRSYLSAMLSKNEVAGSNPYNRRLFLRVGHGLYVLNPALDVDVGGAWTGISDLMGLPHLFSTMGELGDERARWLASVRARMQSEFALHPGVPASPGQPTPAQELA